MKLYKITLISGEIRSFAYDGSLEDVRNSIKEYEYLDIDGENIITNHIVSVAKVN